jgi:uncharacterized Zn-binding protein involved in type VI secretion
MTEFNDIIFDECLTDDARRIAEEQAQQDARPVKARHVLATAGSKTRMGGEVVTTSAEFSVDGFAIARVGDTIRYPDGSESHIDTSLEIIKYDRRAVAIVGSTADNGDTIIDSQQNSVQITEYVDGSLVVYWEEP